MNFASDEWHADETVVKISGQKYYIWFIIDSEARFILSFQQAIQILVQNQIWFQLFNPFRLISLFFEAFDKFFLRFSRNVIEMNAVAADSDNQIRIFFGIIGRITQKL